MSRVAYTDWRPGNVALDIIDQANAIANDYARQGYELTLRQLYYQFVSRDLIANKDSEYKRLGDILGKARMAGLFDWRHLTDRGREVKGGDYGYTGPDQVIRGLDRQYGITHWDDQPEYLEVWVEKQALEDVVSRPARRWDVRYFANKGYNSLSEMWAAGQRIGRQLREGKHVTILHVGDHDPSGIDMTRDIEDRLSTFFAVDLRFDTGVGTFSVDRLALNMDQVDEYNPPPNPAKITDSRAVGYIDTYGESSWELDALEPQVLDDLIDRAIRSRLDIDLYQARLEREDEERQILTALEERWDEVQALLEEER